MSTAKPILVTGSPRSGTTWVGKTIATCPSVGYIHEPFNPFNSRYCPGRCTANFTYWHTYINEENEIDFYDDVKSTLEFRYKLLAQLRANKNLLDFRITFKEYLLFHQYSLYNFIPLIKDPMAVLSCEWLANRFDMNVLVTIRHPAAVASSFKRLGWHYDFAQFLQQPLLMRDYLEPFKTEIRDYATRDRDIIEQAALLWKIIYYLILQVKAKYPNWLYVRYEDIVRSPVISFENICKNLGLDFTAFAKNHIENSLHIPEQSKVYTDKYNSNLNPYYCRNLLTEREIVRIEQNVKDISKNFYSEEDWLNL